MSHRRPPPLPARGRHAPPGSWPRRMAPCDGWRVARATVWRCAHLALLRALPHFFDDRTASSSAKATGLCW